MSDKLSIKQEDFCNKYVESGDKFKAYQRAYSCAKIKDEVVNERALKLLSDRKIKRRIKELTKLHKSKSNKTKKSNPVGRPSLYKDEYKDQAYNYCLLGATDKELAQFFDVQESTINNWKIDYPEFLESIKKGKEIADAEIASSLFNRARGAVVNVQQAFKTKSVTYNEQGKKCEVESIEIVNLRQEQPPDTTASIFWLKNRRPGNWRDKADMNHVFDAPLIVEVLNKDVANEVDKIK